MFRGVFLWWFRFQDCYVTHDSINMSLFYKFEAKIKGFSLIDIFLHRVWKSCLVSYFWEKEYTVLRGKWVWQQRLAIIGRPSKALTALASQGGILCTDCSAAPVVVHYTVVSFVNYCLIIIDMKISSWSWNKGAKTWKNKKKYKLEQ